MVAAAPGTAWERQPCSCGRRAHGLSFIKVLYEPIPHCACADVLFMFFEQHSFFVQQYWKLCYCLDCSIRALRREREFLAKRLTSRLTPEERDALYMRWDVPLDGKHRKMQFVNKLWTNPHDARHVHESAEIVAKLVGFCEGGNMSREMFELNFALPSDKRTWIAGWNQISNLLNLWWKNTFVVVIVVVVVVVVVFVFIYVYVSISNSYLL